MEQREAFVGVDIAPYWRVLPRDAFDDVSHRPAAMRTLRVEPGAGFGVGTHPTTQLCLLALGAFHRAGVALNSVLDFGAGSGILSVAAAVLGAEVDAVEIDPLAIANAQVNAGLNRVHIAFMQSLAAPRLYDVVVANILAEVLLTFAGPLCARVRGSGRLVLSGLVATDVPALSTRFGALLAPMRAQVYAREEWRALVFSA